MKSQIHSGPSRPSEYFVAALDNMQETLDGNGNHQLSEQSTNVQPAPNSQSTIKTEIPRQVDITNPKPDQVKKLLDDPYLNSSLDLSNFSAEQIAKIFQTPRRVTREVKQAKRERLAAAKAAEMEPNAPAGSAEDIYVESNVHFQQWTSDKNIQGVNSRDWEGDDDWQAKAAETGKATPTRAPLKRSTTSKGYGPHGPATDFDLLFNGLNKSFPGVHLEKIRSVAAHPRGSTPWWILNEKALRDFSYRIARSRANPELGISRQRNVCQAAGLDLVILEDFYLQRKEDKQIFEDHRAEFAAERDRQRKTTSTAALTKRRQRLIEKGNKWYGGQEPGLDREQTPAEPTLHENVVVIPISRPRSKPAKRAFQGVVGREGGADKEVA